MKKRILIVDNDFSVCDSLAVLLRGEGHCVDETTDSRRAATLVKKNRYDVCFFDYKMNGLTGIDLSKMTKDVNSQCVVFIFSGMPDLDTLCDKEINAGLITDIISKPPRIEALLQRIAAIA